MMWPPSLLLLLLLLRRGTQAKPSPDAGPHGQGRVHHAAPLSEAPHDDAHGNFQYDHEAFLGREVAKEFDQLTPEESQARLGRIVDRMDRAGDGDGWVSLAELRSWIAHTQQRHIRDSVSAAWNTYDTDRDGRVGWEELRNATYGHYEPGEEFHDVEDAETYKKMLARDERRFRVADQDGDSMATREELTAFLHPEEFPHMRDIVIAETLEDLDRNKDGYVQVDEYIADLYTAEPGEEEPAWVQTEREQFRDFRDHLNYCSSLLKRQNITHLKRPSFHSSPDAGCESPMGGSETAGFPADVPRMQRPWEEETRRRTSCCTRL